ncbi:hypothetical protein QWY85_17315 [Neolewinella lacunae]|uniref:Nucleotide modification associated domain-containing protein n=1 Tax=Neolewinella lacunae TaxID=1517758 RepID=A0A923PLZ5_9BACT|nr:hypothetical protein [Neolewinella lacunae]MBC6995879.1 hypothetical protein [Neolewinella lacunae]MDN3636429.1 hypothetical protein [Neolewinella lacunae]
MKFFIYKVTRDVGFAPNPFDGWCTLACCKPRVRKAAMIGDYIIGMGSKKAKNLGHLIYIMRVTEALTFNQYWNDSRFQVRKPNMNGSLKALRGDNIYHKTNEGNWLQSNSHHSNIDGSTNQLNLFKDTAVDRVLLSNDYLYFGSKSIIIEEKWVNNISISNRDFEYAKDENAALDFVTHVKEIYGRNYMYIADPSGFEQLIRYNPR